MNRVVRILCCCAKEYYGVAGTLGSDYVYFVEGLRAMGHEVHHFDYVKAAFNKEAMNEFFLSLVKRGGYDLVWVTTEDDQFEPEVLCEAKTHTVVVAWNADDNIRWADYSSRWCPHYTWMVTTYRHIYDANKATRPNLLFSQWACTGRYDGRDVKKDIDASFVGEISGHRAAQLTQIRRVVPLEIFGKGTFPSLSVLARRWLARRLGLGRLEFGRVLADEAALKGIWNRTRVSFTPLEGYRPGNLQIKARVFDMGLSGSVMICERHPPLHDYYEPMREYVEFDDMDDCISRMKFLLSHETERAGIAAAYYERTKAEHLWQHRFDRLFRQIGLPQGRH